MARLDLNLLFDPRFDLLPPRISPSKPGFVRVQSLNGRQPVNLPTAMIGKLAYLIGTILGDGYLSKPARRKTHGPGYYWKIVVTGPHDYLVGVQGLFQEIFGIQGVLVKDKRKENTWQLKFANVVLHRFFARVLGLPVGRRTELNGWFRFELVLHFPLHFLAGLLHSDGYVGERYLGIIQKNAQFLFQLKEFARKTLQLNFLGPSINRKMNGRVVGWIIPIYVKEEREGLLRDIARLKLGVGKRAKRI